MISYYRRKPSRKPEGLELFYSQQVPQGTATRREDAGSTANQNLTEHGRPQRPAYLAKAGSRIG